MVLPLALIVAVNVTGKPGQIVIGLGDMVTIGLGCMVTAPVVTITQPSIVVAVSVTVYVPGAG